MLRALLVVVIIAAVVYALADWARCRTEEMPGGLPRILWLVIILLTAPTFALGAFAWIISRAVQAAEARHGSDVPLSDVVKDVSEKLRWHHSAGKGDGLSGVVAPDDDPEFLEKLQRDIARQRANEREAERREKLRRRDDSGDTREGKSADDAQAFNDQEKMGDDNEEKPR